MDADAKIPYVACRDIGRMAWVAATMGPPVDGHRYLPVMTDFVSSDEIRVMFERWHKKPFSYHTAPRFILRLFAHEVLIMRTMFERNGRPPVSDAPETTAQMVETRKLLKNDYWSLERWFIENGMDKKLPPTPPSNWPKIALAAAVAVAAIAYWYSR